MTTQHTPGPWTIAPLWDKPLPDSHIVVKSAHGLTVSVSPINHPDDLGEVLGNARLIAAAPELLELAETLHAYLEDAAGNGSRRAAELLKLSGPAIARATEEP